MIVFCMSVTNTISLSLSFYHDHIYSLYRSLSLSLYLSISLSLSLSLSLLSLFSLALSRSHLNTTFCNRRDTTERREASLFDNLRQSSLCSLSNSNCLETFNLDLSKRTSGSTIRD